MMKILLQRLREERLDWDDPIPRHIKEIWKRWRNKLPTIRNYLIQRCHAVKDADMSSVQLHGFSDTSESAYSAVIYLRMPRETNTAHTTLVMAKTKVAPIKCLTIPRLELCDAVLLSRLLSHTSEILHIPKTDIYAWTDSTVVFGWLSVNPH